MQHQKSRVQTWAEECVNLHEVLKIEIYFANVLDSKLHALSSFIRL